MKKNSYFFNGVYDTSPLVLAATPFGIIFGALSISIGLSPLVTISMSLFVFAGASQFIAVSLISSSASLTVILLAVFFVNLRHMLYSVNLMTYFDGLSQKYRIPLAFWLTDETFAVVNKFVEKKRENSEFVFYYLGSSLAMYFFWSISTVIGILLGKQVPDITNWGLDVVMILAFIGIIVPKLKTRSDWACAATAIFCTIFTCNWQNQIGLLVSSLLAIVVGQLTNIKK